MAVEITTTCDGTDCGVALPNDTPTSPHYDVSLFVGKGRGGGKFAKARFYFSLSGSAAIDGSDRLPGMGHGDRLCAKCWHKAFGLALEELRHVHQSRGKELNDG